MDLRKAAARIAHSAPGHFSAGDAKAYLAAHGKAPAGWHNINGKLVTTRDFLRGVRLPMGKTPAGFDMQQYHLDKTENAKQLLGHAKAGNAHLVLRHDDATLPTKMFLPTEMGGDALTPLHHMAAHYHPEALYHPAAAQAKTDDEYRETPLHTMARMMYEHGRGARPDENVNVYADERSVDDPENPGKRKMVRTYTDPTKKITVQHTYGGGGTYDREESAPLDEDEAKRRLATDKFVRERNDRLHPAMTALLNHPDVGEVTDAEGVTPPPAVQLPHTAVVPLLSRQVLLAPIVSLLTVLPAAPTNKSPVLIALRPVPPKATPTIPLDTLLPLRFVRFVPLTAGSWLLPLSCTS
jgi:hypothetical protein